MVKPSQNPHVRKQQYATFGLSDVVGYKELPSFKMGFNLPRGGRKK